MHRLKCRISPRGLVLLLACYCPILIAVNDPSYGVLYPVSHGPYQNVFKSVISGVESKLNGYYTSLAISGDTDFSKTNSWLKKNDIRVLVTLGKQGLDLCEGLSTNVHLIAGAILSPPDEGCQIRSGIALAPHPERLFKKLLTMQPEVKTIHVVFNPEFSGWLMRYAKEASKSLGVSLAVHNADSLEQAAKIYREIVSSGLGPDDAIWLPQDPYTVDQKTILPVLLRESWKDMFVVFSSSAAHVKRGVLFGLYPDFQAMGARLGEMALQTSDSNSIKDSPIQPLTDVLIAVNLRTADHLKLNLKKSVREKFDLTFPASR